jgi:hypothetical protein
MLLTKFAVWSHTYDKDEPENDEGYNVKECLEYQDIANEFDLDRWLIVMTAHLIDERFPKPHRISIEWENPLESEEPIKKEMIAQLV